MYDDDDGDDDDDFDFEALTLKLKLPDYASKIECPLNCDFR